MPGALCVTVLPRLMLDTPLMRELMLGGDLIVDGKDSPKVIIEAPWR